MPPPLPPQPQSNNKPPLLVSADDECYPFIRSLANYAASKVSSLSESDISLLSDDALTRLIESQLERLSEDELNRLYDATGSPFLPITDAIFDSIFPPVITQPKKKEKEYSEENLSDIASYIVTSYIKC
ncbi:hypothetical protein TSUD_239300 [Trifolium subterraneum]|uniref:Uncharacterized protein n=1 Tax=Trifolium subterraneum TaxID=3900 RepID=A0A2Z6PFE8_TRISU|nr:hypothetical protein TSUD_239300 [Trifolium subterraneum]